MISSARREGTSLLEVIISIGLVSVILMSLVTLSTKSVSNSTVSKEKNQATRYTQETIEWVRQQRDESWKDFNDHINTNRDWCLPENNWTTAGRCSGQTIPGTSFTREVNFTRPATDTVEVTVVTRWMESGKVNESRAATVLTKWQ